MKLEETLPLGEQVGETKAEAEDRLEQALVPKLEATLGALASSWAAMRDRLASWRAGQK